MCTAPILCKKKGKQTGWPPTIFQKIWLATDQILKNGCSPTIFKNYGWPPTKISKMVAHRPISKFWWATDQNFKNGCSPTDLKNFGWPPTKIENFGWPPTKIKNCGWPPNKIKNLVGSQPKLKFGGLLTKRFGGFLANEFLHGIIQILIKSQAWKTTWQDGTIQPAAKLLAKSQTLNFVARSIF